MAEALIEIPMAHDTDDIWMAFVGKYLKLNKPQRVDQQAHMSDMELARFEVTLPRVIFEDEQLAAERAILLATRKQRLSKEASEENELFSLQQQIAVTNGYLFIIKKRLGWVLLVLLLPIIIPLILAVLAFFFSVAGLISIPILKSLTSFLM